MVQARRGFSLGAQEKDAALFAAEQGWQLPDHLRFRDGEERNASGADWDLEGLNAMIDAAKRREFSILIVPEPDRFARNMTKALVLEEQLRKFGVRVVYIRMPLEDSPEGNLLKNQLHAFAEYEREKFRMRAARGKREKAERGLVVGTGVAPFGYRYVLDARGKQSQLAIDEARAKVVRRIFHDSARMSMQRVCDGLNADGILTLRPERASAGWVVATLQGILHSPVYLGQNPYGRRAGKYRVPVRDQSLWLFSAVPPIITQQEWDAAHAGMTRRLITRSARTPETAEAYQLRSALTCGHCGGPLRCEPNGHGSWRYYACLRNKPSWAATHARERCQLPMVPAEPLERLAWEEVVATLLDPVKLRAGLEAARVDYATAKGRRAEQLGVLEREIASARARLSRLVDEQLEAPAGSELARLYREKATRMESQIERLHAEHAALPEAPHMGLSDEQAVSLERFATEVRAGIDKAGPADRRDIFGLLQLRGTVSLDPNGRRLARVNRFRIVWTAIIALQSEDRKLTNIQTIVVGATKAPAPPAE